MYIFTFHHWRQTNTNTNYIRTCTRRMNVHWKLTCIVVISGPGVAGELGNASSPEFKGEQLLFEVLFTEKIQIIMFLLTED